MGKYDKDRYQKEMAIRYCLATGMAPYLEVFVPSSSELSDTVETLTDIDVLGLEPVSDGQLRRTIFDCKTGNMSAINRAFWAAGLKEYVGCDEAVIILKGRAVYNHRVSSLRINVDLHDEMSFEALSKTLDLEFGKDTSYQASIERWNAVYAAYKKNAWTKNLYELGRDVTPLTREPWRAFRRIVSELRSTKGQFDPEKKEHVTIFLDVLAAVFTLWSSMGRDIRRFYDPKMTKPVFEKALKYYVWGGRESYQIRHELRRMTSNENAQEFPAWEQLMRLVGIIIDAPQELFGCINICRDLSIRYLCGQNPEHDKVLSAAFSQNRRARQFVMAMSDYMIEAAGIPKDFATKFHGELGQL